MRKQPNPDMERYRQPALELENYGHSPVGTPNGLFMMRYSPGVVIRMIAAVGDGWEHVSVSLEDRTPLWEEMCAVKDIFWDEEETVIQFHPAKSSYVNHHPYCLHLWRRIDVNIGLPPTYMVGPKS
jgi:hypothetical protein